MNVQIYIEIGKEEITSGWSSGLEVHLEICTEDIDALPSGNKKALTGTQLKAYELLMNTILHELCHSVSFYLSLSRSIYSVQFGAFHAETGLMSGEVPLAPDFRLKDILDDHTALIISETLHKFMDEDLFCDFSCNASGSTIKFDCVYGFRGIFFLRR